MRFNGSLGSSTPTTSRHTSQTLQWQEYAMHTQSLCSQILGHPAHFRLPLQKTLERAYCLDMLSVLVVHFCVHEVHNTNISLCLRGRLKRSARAVQLFGRLAVLETHTLRY